MIYEYISRGSNKRTYICRDQLGKIHKFDSNQIKIKISQGNKFINLVVKSGRLYEGINHITNTISKYFNIQNVSDLSTELNRVSKYNERNIVSEIVRYINKPLGNSLESIFVIHGIRRTGKTVAMYQSINRLIQSGINSDRVKLITVINDKDLATFEGLREIIDNTTSDIIFIDEVTRIKDFIDNAAYLSDIVGLKKKIIVAGTDSFVFPKALSTTLYRRGIVYHSTLIDYIEYAKLNRLDINRESIDNCIIHGGVIVETEFSNIQNANNTLSAVTFANIQNSVFRNKRLLGDVDNKLLKLNQSEFVYFVYNIIKDCNNHRNKSELNRHLKQVISSLNSYIESNMGLAISSNYQNIKLDTLLNLINILSQLDIITLISNIAINENIEDIGIKPVTQLDIICMIQSLFVTVSTNKIIKMDGKLLGKLFENFIISQTIMYSINHNNLYNVHYCKYNYKGIQHEIDMVVENNTNILHPIRIAIEIKHSDKFKEEYINHLKDKSLESILGDNFRKAIVYFGDTRMIGKIQLINIVDYLSNMDKWLN